MNVGDKVFIPKTLNKVWTGEGIAEGFHDGYVNVKMTTGHMTGKTGGFPEDKIEQPPEVVHALYPKTLYVVSKEAGFIRGIKQLIGSGYLQSTVDEGKETEVAVYQLVGVETYKKTVIRTETVEKVPVPACGLINHEPGNGCADCRDSQK